jgi:hypothetical protein
MMTGSSLTLARVLATAMRPAASSADGPPAEALFTAPGTAGELSDDDLEFVVGGLARVRLAELLPEPSGSV